MARPCLPRGYRHGFHHSAQVRAMARSRILITRVTGWERCGKRWDGDHLRPHHDARLEPQALRFAVSDQIWPDPHMASADRSHPCPSLHTSASNNTQEHRHHSPASARRNHPQADIYAETADLMMLPNDDQYQNLVHATAAAAADEPQSSLPGTCCPFTCHKLPFWKFWCCQLMLTARIHPATVPPFV